MEYDTSNCRTLGKALSTHRLQYRPMRKRDDVMRRRALFELAGIGAGAKHRDVGHAAGNAVDVRSSIADCVENEQVTVDGRIATVEFTVPRAAGWSCRSRATRNPRPVGVERWPTDGASSSPELGSSRNPHPGSPPSERFTRSAAPPGTVASLTDRRRSRRERFRSAGGRGPGHGQSG